MTKDEVKFIYVLVDGLVRLSSSEEFHDFLKKGIAIKFNHEFTNECNRAIKTVHKLGLFSHSEKTEEARIRNLESNANYYRESSDVGAYCVGQCLKVSIEKFKKGAKT